MTVFAQSFSAVELGIQRYEVRILQPCFDSGFVSGTGSMMADTFGDSLLIRLHSLTALIIRSTSSLLGPVTVQQYRCVGICEERIATHRKRPMTKDRPLLSKLC